MQVPCSSFARGPLGCGVIRTDARPTFFASLRSPPSSYSPVLPAFPPLPPPPPPLLQPRANPENQVSSGHGDTSSSSPRAKSKANRLGGTGGDVMLSSKSLSVTPSYPGGTAGSSIYCVCHSSDEGFMVECSDGTGGCGGWFHPECCNLELSEEQRRKSERRGVFHEPPRYSVFCLVCLLVSCAIWV